MKAKPMLASSARATHGVWAIVGVGWNVVFWGAVLLAMGMPVYLSSGSRRASRATKASATGAPDSPRE